MSATIGRVLLMPKGTYSGSTVYNSLDWVRYNGSAWVCKVDGTVGVVPVEGANWTVLAQDGNVSGNVDWDNVNYKPFDDLAVGGGLDVDGSNNLMLDPNYLVGSNIGYDNTASGLVADDTQEAIDELAGMTVDLSTDLLAGSNITLTTKPDGKVEIASTGGGGGGSSTFAGLSDTDINNPVADQIVQYKNVGGELKLQNVNMPQGGHNMLDNSTIIAGINSSISEGTSNDDVVSGYGVGIWSNVDGIKILSPQLSTGTDTIGTWEDDDTWETGSRVGWIWHSALYNILGDDDYDIEPIFKLASGKQTAISCLSYRIDDNVSNGGVNGGAFAIKLNAPIPAEQNNVKVGLLIKHNRTNTFNGTAISS